MNVSGVRNDLSKPKDEVFNEMFSSNDLATAVSGMDYIVTALPGTEKTKDVFNDQVFKSMKQGAVFINIGRGDSVDEDAMRKALHNGTLKGVGLDVVKNEPITEDHWIYQDKEIKDKVLLTCH